MLKTQCVVGLLQLYCNSYVPNARIIQVPPSVTAEALAQERLWEATCRPVVVTDREGLRRYVYDKACPNGVIVGR